MEILWMIDSLAYLINTLWQFSICTFSATTTTSLSLISGTAATNLSIQSASLLFKSANSFKMLWTSALFISSISDSDPMVSQSDCSPLSFTQYGSNASSSDGTIAEITTFSVLTPGSLLITNLLPSCFRCFPPLLLLLPFPLRPSHLPSSYHQTSRLLLGPSNLQLSCSPLSLF